MNLRFMLKPAALPSLPLFTIVPGKEQSKSQSAGRGVLEWLSRGELTSDVERWIWVDDVFRRHGDGTEDAIYGDGTVGGGFREDAIGFRNNREMAMLVLSRKLGEKIVIGDNIVVTVVKIDRNQIRIGIEAPHDVPVYREEIAPQRMKPGATEAVVLSR
jgi:carbon storage regulator